MSQPVVVNSRAKPVNVGERMANRRREGSFNSVVAVDGTESHLSTLNGHSKIYLYICIPCGGYVCYVYIYIYSTDPLKERVRDRQTRMSLGLDEF